VVEIGMLAVVPAGDLREGEADFGEAAKAAVFGLFTQLCLASATA